MAEVLVVYDTRIGDDSGSYSVRSVGRRAADGMWEGWLEFVPLEGGRALVSGVETRQPEREHLVYWATGLTPVYLEGALERAQNPVTVSVRVLPAPHSEAPAPRRPARVPPVAARPEPVLDPFEIGARSLDVLRQELAALNRPRLLNIIAAFDLNPGGEDLHWMTDAQLVHFIVVAVDTQLAGGRIP